MLEASINTIKGLSKLCPFIRILIQAPVTTNLKYTVYTNDDIMLSCIRLKK